MKKIKLQRGACVPFTVKKVVLMTKLTMLLILISFMQISAKVYSQEGKLDINVKNLSIQKIFEEIEGNSEYRFFYDNEQVDLSKNVSINTKGEELTTLLKELFKGTDLTYEIKDQLILVKSKNPKIISNVQLRQKSVNGLVTDEAGEPLPGVTVVIKGTAQGTVTNTDGEYSLNNIPEDAILQFSFVGMQTQEIEVGSQAMINITMVANAIGIDEVVAVGYGVQKKSTSTYAISTLNSSEIVKMPSSNLSNVLSGRLSGTTVTAFTGVPGISSNIKVRGTASWNGGDVVYVIDGVVRDKSSFDALDPSEVDDISVLKDASSAAIYGSRATNGVILVKTKNGKRGKPVINLNVLMGTSRIAELPPYMNLKDNLVLLQNVLGGIGDDEIDWVEKNNPNRKALFDLVYKNPNTKKYNLDISGGNDFVTYFLSGAYYKENGYISTVDYEKYNIRAKVSANITQNLTAGLNLSTSRGDRNRYNATYDDHTSLTLTVNSLFSVNPWMPAYIDGKATDWGWVANLPELITNSGTWNNQDQHIDALFNIEYKVPFLKGLSLKGMYSRNVNNSFIKTFAKKHKIYTFEKTGSNGRILTDKVVSSRWSTDPSREYIGNELEKNDSYQLNTQVSYNRSFGEHNISADAVYEQHDYHSNYFYGYRYNFPLFPKDQFFAASGDNQDWSTGGNENQNARLSYIFRLNYDYAGKYVLAASLRRDGSIKFAPNQRWGSFPAISAGWVLSKENFYENSSLFNVINFAKVRLSYGSTGNDAIGGWKWVDQYNILSSNYYLGVNGTTAPRLSYGGIPNPYLTWEKSDSYNFGLDLRFFNDRMNFSFESWKRHTYDILGARILAMPVEFGGSLPQENYGVVDSHGLEFEIGYKNVIGNDLHFEIRGNFSTNDTKVIKRDVASNSQEIDNPNGKTLSRYIGYQFEGILRTQKDIDALPEGFTHFGAAPALGSAKFADISGPAGTPDGKVDSYDRIELSDHFGPGAAPYSFGLYCKMEYKGFYFDAMFSGLAGYEKSMSASWVDGRNLYSTAFILSPFYGDSWSEDNVDAKIPKLYGWGHPQSYGYVQSSKLNVWSVGFLRLKNINLGYEIPKNWINKVGIKGASVFVSGTNLFTITNYKYGDPELDNDGAYPLMSTYSFG